MTTFSSKTRLYGVRKDYTEVNALLLDCDGTIRSGKDSPFPKNPDDIELLPNSREIVDAYKKRGYHIFLLSNQGGVAHGFQTPQTVWQTMTNTTLLFPKNTFSGVYWAIAGDRRGKIAPYNLHSVLRKPGVGMPALCELNMLLRGKIINWENSIFVGDRKEDFDCANAIPCPFIWAFDFFLREKPKEIE